MLFSIGRIAVLFLGLFLLAVLTPPIHAQLGGLDAGMSGLCKGVYDLVPVAGMLMVLVGAAVYASGQVMGAETRARANVWATASLTGALMAMLIVAVAPPAFKFMDPTMRADCSYVCFGTHVSRVVAAGSACCTVWSGNAAYGCPADRPFCKLIGADGGCFKDAAFTDGVTCNSLGTCGRDCTFDTNPPVCPG